MALFFLDDDFAVVMAHGAAHGFACFPGDPATEELVVEVL